MFVELASILAPVFICAALGWGWVRLGRAYDRELISRLITDIGAPCLIFSRIMHAGVDPALMLRIAGIAVLAMTSFGIIGAVALRISGLRARTFLAPLTFGNAGNMGLPLCLFAFGEPGLALAISYFTISALLQFTVGIWIWTGRVSLIELLRTPVAYAGVAAAVGVATNLEIPVWIVRTTDMLGGLAIPLMLITLGVSLAEIRVGTLRRTFALSVFRLAMGFGVGVGLSWLFELGELASGVLIMQCSMPPAVFNYLFATRYGQSPEEVASLVVGCTLLSFLLLPLLLAFVL